MFSKLFPSLRPKDVNTARTVCDRNHGTGTNNRASSQSPRELLSRRFAIPLLSSTTTRSRILFIRQEDEDKDDKSKSKSSPLAAAIPKQRTPMVHNAPRSLYAASALANSSNSSLLNFSRPTIAHVRHETSSTLRDVSPLTIAAKIDFPGRGHSRKHSQTQGSFEPYLPTAATSNLSSMANPNPGLSASQIAAQAAMQQQSQQHLRQRSQTVPGSQMADGATNGSAV